MAHEQIKNSLFENVGMNVSFHFYIDSHKSLSFFLVDNIVKNSKTQYCTINFDPLYYRHRLQTHQEKVKLVLDFEIKEIKELIGTSKNLIIIGADYLQRKDLKSFLKCLKNAEVIKILFFTSSKSNSNPLISNFCNVLVKEVSPRQGTSNFFVQVDVFNLAKNIKDNMVLQYNLQNNHINNFLSFIPYAGDVKKLFEEEPLEQEHETTFNVKMTKEDIKAKSEVALPYLKTAEEKRKDLIVIEQQDIDEYYEEDPDEDLDI